jgi:D-alanine transaminase
MFGFKNGKLYTHPATNLILNGITRQVVLRLCHDLGIQVVEEAFTLEEAVAMDEFFLTSTTSEVTPVISIDGSPIGSGKPGELTMKLQEAFALQIPLLTTGE